MPSIKNYFSLVKFSHTIFAFPFAMIGFFMAITSTHTALNLNLLLLVTFCMITVRNAAMGFNRYIDRKFDQHNARTQQREIPAGKVTPLAALFFVLLNCLLFIAATYMINSLCFFLSPVALFVILGYSYTKRFTFLCHFILGVGLSLAPIGAFIALTGVFKILPILVSVLVLFWVSGFDIIYALQDADFDSKQKLHSLPQALGVKNAIILSTLIHIVCVALLLAIGLYGQLGILYWIGAGIFATLLFYQHTLVKPTDLSKINLAFGTTNGIASIVFATFVIADMYLY